MIPNTLILLVISIFLYVYWFYKKSFSYFEKRNVPHLKPDIFFGNIGDTILKKKYISDVYSEIYRKLEPHRIVGLFNLHKPMYMVRDPELIKIILVKNFENFPDRRRLVNFGDEPTNNPLTMMTGNQWKNYRTKLTPAFSSGKIKTMIPSMRTCGENLIRFLNHFNPNDDFELKDLCYRLLTDVFAYSAFGLKTNAVENPESEFSKVRKEAAKPRIQSTIRSQFPNIPQKIVRYFQLYLFDEKIVQFYSRIILDTVKYREENKITRNDFLGLLLELKNNCNVDKFHDIAGKKFERSKVDMTSTLLVSQSFAFLLGGTESTSSALSMLLLELALHSEIQDKVRKEINDIWKNNEGELTYEDLKNMKYTDMVISETFRLHPSFETTSRSCRKNFKIPHSEIVINEGDMIMIPILALHRDKKYYEKPDTFYPEHFTEEAIANRPYFSYLPFGGGQRICIAVRYVNIVMKMVLIHFLKDFSYHVSPKMKFPLQYIIHSVLGNSDLKNGVWLRCKKI